MKLQGHSLSCLRQRPAQTHTDRLPAGHRLPAAQRPRLLARGIQGARGREAWQQRVRPRAPPSRKARGACADPIARVQCRATRQKLTSLASSDRGRNQPTARRQRRVGGTSAGRRGGLGNLQADFRPRLCLQVWGCCRWGAGGDGLRRGAIPGGPRQVGSEEAGGLPRALGCCVALPRPEKGWPVNSARPQALRPFERSPVQKASSPRSPQGP